MAEMLIVTSKVKKLVKAAGYRTGIDYLDALSSQISTTLNASIEKVKLNGKKKTLGAEDI